MFGHRFSKKNKKQKREWRQNCVQPSTPNVTPTAIPNVFFFLQSVSEDAARGLRETLILHSGRTLFLHPLSHQEMEFNIQNPHHAAASRLYLG